MTYGALAARAGGRRRPAAPRAARAAAGTPGGPGPAPASCDADGTCGTTWVGAERDGWAAGRGFVNGSFISTASLPARARSTVQRLSAHRGPATPAAAAPRCGPAGAPAAGRPRARSTSAASTGPPRGRPSRPAGSSAVRGVGGEQDQAAPAARDGLRRPRRPPAPRRASLLRTADVSDSAGTPQVAPDHLRPLVGRAAVDHQRHVAGRAGSGRPSRGGLQRAGLDPLARRAAAWPSPRARAARGGAHAGDHEDGR